MFKKNLDTQEQVNALFSSYLQMSTSMLKMLDDLRATDKNLAHLSSQLQQAVGIVNANLKSAADRILGIEKHLLTIKTSRDNLDGIQREETQVPM